MERFLDKLNPYSAGITAVELVTLICHIHEHQPTRAETCAQFDISKAKFKRVLDVARFFGVDIRAVPKAQQTETYYVIKGWGIFNRARLMEMREHL